MGWGSKRLRGRRRIPVKSRDKKRSKRVEQPQEDVLKGVWNKRKSARKNYEELGLMINPNARKPQKEATTPVEIIMPPPMPRKKRHLTIPEIINARELLMKHGTDYQAMFRDIKTNCYQHTPSRLREICEVYLKECAHRDPLFVVPEQLKSMFEEVAARGSDDDDENDDEEDVDDEEDDDEDGNDSNNDEDDGANNNNNNDDDDDDDDNE